MPEKKLSHRSSISSFYFLIRFFDPISWIFSMLNSVTERKGVIMSKLRTLRWVTAVIGVGNIGLVVLGSFISVSGLLMCSRDVKLSFVIVPLVAGVRIFCMVGAGFAQVATAAIIVNYSAASSVAVDAVTRRERRVRYRRWLWWTRFGMGVTALQFTGALYLTFVLVKNFSYDGKSKKCFLGWDAETRDREWISMICFAIVAWLVVIIQCFTGTDVLRWRSFYATHDTAWRAHYLEVFDHGIREALCCLGRVKYMSVLEEDEVYSVAHLLGDLVAYRASGTGHLEFLAGLALLQSHGQSSHLNPELVEHPQTKICEAAPHHQFAEAAYTGPLLDFGRNPILFPCAWLYRQGILSPWTRNRRPILEGDNWWRGHAAAFLKYANLPPDTLRRGRVSQTKREAAYFIVVLHHSKSVVIAVRGTETPEDLLTDVLCRECTLTENDLDGLLNSDHVDMDVKEKVLSSFPHYGHSGIVECARELFMQIDGTPEVKDGYLSETTGFLSSLMGVGKECHGYKICIAGHSLGGSVATLLGIRLYRRYPNLHVYSYGTLPCVNLIIAEACSSFVTCIVYNDEFSARLSVRSIIRLRTAAITALSDDSTTDSDIIHKITRQILEVGNSQQKKKNHSSDTLDSDESEIQNKHPCKSNFKHTVKGGCCVVSSVATKPDESIQEFCSQERGTSSVENLSVDDEKRKEYNESNHTDAIENTYSSNFDQSRNQISCEDPRSQCADNPPEMFLPGLIIHIVQDDKSFLPSWKKWRSRDNKRGYSAFVANREQFMDIAVTPYMFLDHLPWRCNYAMQRVVEYQKDEHPPTDNSLNV